MEMERMDASTAACKKRVLDEDSWTAVDHQELDHATSYVSESMYLVMQNPVSVLYPGESVRFKAHAQCDRSTKTLAGIARAATHPREQVAPVYGTLFLTEYRLLFLSFQGASDPPGPGPDADTNADADADPDAANATSAAADTPPQSVVQVFLHNVAELYEGRAQGKDGVMLSQLEVSCKNFEIVKFNFPNELMSGELYVRLVKTLGSQRHPEMAFVATDAAALPDESGWRVFDTQSEFVRLGFRVPHEGSQRPRGFRLTHVNSGYKICPTYPRELIVPASISDGDLRNISLFRARGRIPAVTYRHKNDAVLVRCGQPLVGLRRKRSTADEAFIAAIRRETNTKVVFIDCRSQTSAYGNIALGGGFEILDNYRDSGMLFMGIENIHSMRDSIRKLFDLIKCEVRGNERSNWLSCLEATRWLEHVRSILVACAICVTKIADEQTSLVVHCSDGWDRTAQIVALTKLCLDPFYRTIKGFSVLIEQEWCAFGHQFRARSGRSSDRAGYWEDDNASPVFAQFIDAVWQLTRQFPCSFEFTERFLVALVDEVYTKRSGTFLFDCEEARVSAQAETRSISAWSLLARQDRAGDFVNPFFVVHCQDAALTERLPPVLQFKWHTSSLAIWSAFYLRSLEANDSRDAWAKELQVTQRELQEQLSNAHQRLQSQLDENSELHEELESLRKERAHLQMALQGQVFSDAARGLCIHEEDSDEDGVLLSVTHVPGAPSNAISAPITIPGRANLPTTSGISDGLSSSASSSFIGASISPSFEILQSYFEPTRLWPAPAIPAQTSVSAAASAAVPHARPPPSARPCECEELSVALSAQILEDSAVR